MKGLDNLSLARQALSLLEAAGVRTIIVCAGARNAPLVKSLDHFSNFEILYFFDERAAAFFALGRSKSTNAPVAVMTTSGTAVAELLPAVIEARYSQIPLVLVSADRPKNFRGRGAPQSIEQVGIFSHYIESENQSDWDAASAPVFTVSPRSPSHLNICFSEPLLADEVSPPAPAIAGDFSSIKKPLVILGEIPARDRARVESFLMKLRAPVYAEAHSGLRHSVPLESLLLRSGDRLLGSAFFQSQFDGVIRIGSVPTTRLWRDLEDKLIGWGVLSVCDNPMSGLGRKADGAISFQTFFTERQEGILASRTAVQNEKVLRTDRECAEKLEGLIKAYPTSEPSFVRRLSDELKEGARVFVGNSLPIREWDLAANFKSLEVAGNRGVNGIDGLVSTFLGWAKPDCENVILLGDLSALYDLSALWTDSQQATPPVKIVVMNNSGGQIFNRMFRDPRFLNQHELEFSKWAEMFGLDYVLIDKNSKDGWQKLSATSPKSIVFELRPDNAATQDFWAGYEKLFQ